MKKNSQVLIGLVIVVVIAVGAYALFHKSSKSTSTTPAYSSSSTSSQSSTKPAASGDIIQTKTASGVGQYLADSNGDALYTYGADSSGKSNCSGSCLEAWPIYEVAQSSASLPTNVTVITRSDGKQQYAYKGMPLYTFASDSSGKVTGNNVENFQVAKP